MIATIYENLIFVSKIKLFCQYDCLNIDGCIVRYHHTKKMFLIKIESHYFLKFQFNRTSAMKFQQWLFCYKHVQTNFFFHISIFLSPAFYLTHFVTIYIFLFDVYIFIFHYTKNIQLKTKTEKFLKIKNK